MNGRLIFLTSLVVLLSCFSAANAGFEIKVDIAKGKESPPYYEEWTAKEGWLPWHRYGDGIQHDATYKENIGGTGLTVGIGAGDATSTPGTVLGWTTSADEPICNTWIMCGETLGPNESSIHLALSGDGLIPGTYRVYGYHNTPASEPCMPDILPRVTVHSFSYDYYRPDMGAPNDVDGGGVIVEANDADVPVQHETLDGDLTTSLVKFYTDGSPVMITYEADVNNMGILNAFIIQQVGAAPTAGRPFPVYEEEHACPDTILTWEAGQDANTHRVYFGTDLTEEVPIFYDDFEDGDANWVRSNWTLYDSNVLEDGNNDGNSASFKYSMTPGSGLGTLTSVAIDTNDAGSMRVQLSIKHTLGTEAGDIDLYYYNGSGWDYIADLNSVGPNDVWRTYTDDVNESEYLRSNFKLELRSDISAGEVFIDNVRITNTWPIHDEWLVYSGDANSYTPPSNLDFDKTYYWRVDEVNDACSASPWKGYLWNFTTETGKARDPDPRDHAGFKPLEGITLQWTPSCLATGGDYLYLSTDFDDVNDSNSLVRSGPLSTPQLTGPLLYATKYYWKVNGIGAGLPEGDVWSFQTTGYPLLHYEFDGVLDAKVGDIDDANFLTDSTGNVTFRVSGNGELRYGEPNPLYNIFGTSACFIPTRADDDDDWQGSRLLRNCFGPDLLDLDGSEYTIEAWVRQDGRASGVRDNDMEGTIIRKDRLTYGLGIDDDGAVKFMHNGEIISSETTGVRITRGEWYHIAAVYDDSDPSQNEKLYINGVVVADNNVTTHNPADDYGSDYVGIGAYRWDAEETSRIDNHFNGAIDELKVIDIALAPDEFLIRGDKRLAWLPRPSNGRRGVPYDTSLLWNPGELASSHNVYFGTNWDDVNDATTASHPNVDYNNVEPNSWDPGLLDLGTTYYWRVDEVNDTNSGVWKGYVWRFTTDEMVVLDDFESYDKTNNLIWYTWYCYYSSEYGVRSGARLSLSTSIVHGDEQAMKYEYITDGTEIWDQDYNYADACLPLDEIDGFQDWTTVDVRLLSIFFYGQAENDTNDTEQMYMAVHNASGNYAEVRYGDHDGEDMNDLKVEEWQRWDVPFIWFTDSNAAVSANVDFSAIASVYLGFGDRRDPVPAGNGIAYFDDLRVSIPICKYELLKPPYDFSNNCIVDIADVGIMGEEWLTHDVNFLDDLGIQVQQPPDANLLGHWKLDEGTGTFAYDSSDYENDGTLETLDVNVSWVAGHDGNALEFDGGRVRVPDAPELRDMDQVSVSAWIKYSDEQDDGRIVVKGADGNETYQLEVDDEDDLVFHIRDGNADPCGKYLEYEVGSDGDALERDEWTHVAGTFDGNTIKCYVNGELADDNNDPNISAIPFLRQDTNDLGIGMRPDANDDEFEGTIDDVRIYNYGLSQAEVAWLATEGSGYVPLISAYNIYYGEPREAVNMRDFAELLKYWGDEQLWPPEPAP